MIGWVILLLIIVIGLYWFVIRKKSLTLSGDYLILPDSKDKCKFTSNDPFTIKAKFTIIEPFNSDIFIVKKLSSEFYWALKIEQYNIQLFRSLSSNALMIHKFEPGVTYTVVVNYDGVNTNFNISSDKGIVTKTVSSPMSISNTNSGDLIVGNNDAPISLNIENLQIINELNKSTLTWNFPNLKALESNDTFVLKQL
jgi:hypothetical protein